MKKLKWYEVLFIILVTALATFAIISCDSTKGHDWEGKDLPEPYLSIDKQVKFSGQKKVGSKIKFWVQMPEPYTNDLQWYFEYGDVTDFVSGTDTMYHTYKKAGVYYVKVVGWEGEAFNSKQGWSDAAKLQILGQSATME